MDLFIVIILLATLVQFIVDRLKALIPVAQIGTVKLAPIYALIIGITFAIMSHVNIITMAGFEMQPLIGEITTGIIISGGSAFVHEVIAKLRESRGQE
jgi:hypothetical protein